MALLQTLQRAAPSSRLAVLCRCVVEELEYPWCNMRGPVSMSGCVGEGIGKENGELQHPEITQSHPSAFPHSKAQCHWAQQAHSTRLYPLPHAILAHGIPAPTLCPVLAAVSPFQMEPWCCSTSWVWKFPGRSRVLENFCNTEKKNGGSSFWSPSLLS